MQNCEIGLCAFDSNPTNQTAGAIELVHFPSEVECLKRHSDKNISAVIYATKQHRFVFETWL